MLPQDHARGAAGVPLPAHLFLLRVVCRYYAAASVASLTAVNDRRIIQEGGIGSSRSHLEVPHPKIISGAPLA